MPALEHLEGNDLSAVVGLGASAGGLEPLHAVLWTFPLGDGICVIVVQHLAERPAAGTPICCCWT